MQVFEQSKIKQNYSVNSLYLSRTNNFQVINELIFCIKWDYRIKRIVFNTKMSLSCNFLQFWQYLAVFLSPVLKLYEDFY